MACIAQEQHQPETEEVNAYEMGIASALLQGWSDNWWVILLRGIPVLLLGLFAFGWLDGMLLVLVSASASGAASTRETAASAWRSSA